MTLFRGTDCKFVVRSRLQPQVAEVSSRNSALNFLIWKARWQIHETVNFNYTTQCWALGETSVKRKLLLPLIDHREQKNLRTDLTNGQPFMNDK